VLAFVGKTLAKSQPLFDLLALLCVAEVLKAQEEELKGGAKPIGRLRSASRLPTASRRRRGDSEPR
jgi:hypothetical protein